MKEDPSELKDAVAAPARLTYDDLLASLPESNRPCELWDGEVIMSPAPSCDHQEIVLRFYRHLFAWVDSRQLGRVFTAPLDVVLSPHRVVQPDVMFVARERLGIVRRVIEGPPDLVAEVVSLGGRNRDRVEKRDLYEQHGIREYWLVDPESHTIEVFALESSGLRLVHRAGSGHTAKSQLLAGFAVPVDEVFAGVRDGV